MIGGRAQAAKAAFSRGGGGCGSLSSLVRARMSTSLLSSVLDNTVSASNGAFILISDSLIQPGLIVLRQIVSNSVKQSVTEPDALQPD